MTYTVTVRCTALVPGLEPLVELFELGRTRLGGESLVEFAESELLDRERE